MGRFIRYALLFVISLCLTLLILLWNPEEPGDPYRPAPTESAPMELSIAARITEEASQAIQDLAQHLQERIDQQPEEPASKVPSPPFDQGSQVVTEMESEPASENGMQRPPSEDGSPDGEDETADPGPTTSAPEEEAIETGKDRKEEIESLMNSPTHQDQARRELSGESRLGFETAFRCAPEDQLRLAQFFGEKIVLVPRSALDPRDKARSYFVLEPGPPSRLSTISGTPPVTRFRQYRDLFDFDYSRLPEEIRNLRRNVVSRSDVYLFASLIPVREWALIAARRQEALQQYLGGDAHQDPAEVGVKRFVLRYEPLPQGGFDILVDEILFADNRIHKPQRS